MNQTKFRTTLFSIVFCAFTHQIIAQSPAILGLQLNVESKSGIFSNIHSGLGLTIEKQFRAHSGISSGLFYRRLSNELTISYENQYYYPTINEHYLYIPIQYKFYSNILNFSTGISFSQYIGWTCNNSSINITGYSSGKNFNFGLTGSLSKSFKLGDKSFLEPSLYCELSYVTFFGLGISYKYKFNK